MSSSLSNHSTVKLHSIKTKNASDNTCVLPIFKQQIKSTCTYIYQSACQKRYCFEIFNRSSSRSPVYSKRGGVIYSAGGICDIMFCSVMKSEWLVFLCCLLVHRARGSPSPPPAAPRPLQGKPHTQRHAKPRQCRE